MRTLASWGVIVSIAIAAIAAGIVAGQEPASPRPADQTVAVDDAWYYPSALEYGLFFNHPSDAERVMTAMQWRAAMQGTPHWRGARPQLPP